MARSARMIGFGGAIPTSSRRFWFLDRSEKGLLDYGIAWPIWGDPADRQTGRFPCPDRRGKSYPYSRPSHRPAGQRVRLTAPPGAGMAVSLRNRVALKILRASVEGFRPWRTGFTPPASACFEHCSLSTTSVDHRGPPSMPRAELGIHGLKARTATGLEKSEKRGVQAARNGPSPPPTPAGGPVAKAEMSTADRLGSVQGRGRAGPPQGRGVSC